MISRSDLPSDQTMTMLGAGVALALLVAFTAVVHDAVDAGQRRWIVAAGGGAAAAARSAVGDVASLQATAGERRSRPAR